ncbi:MAG: nucleotidyltransferase family protein [Mogibacterium sp.]|nr:nucleotidyltransferase family protein [Mogibacterium sp.]
MNDAQKTVLNLTSAALFGNPASVPAETDWQAVYDEIKKQELVSLLLPLASKFDIPDGVLKQWSEDRDKYLLNNARNISAHFTIQKLMDSADIPCVILKGVASGSYYPDYLTRAYGDVDFLVPDKYYKRADALLRKTGYELVRSIDKDRKYLRNSLHYELHRDVAEFPDAASKSAAGKYLSDIFEQAKEFKHSGAKCMVPSDRHHAVILMVHSAEHLWSSGIGLRHLSDWAVFVNKMPDSFFEKELQPILRDLKLRRFCGTITNLCTEHLGLRRCKWAEEAAADYASDLIEDLFKSGSFGHNYTDQGSEKTYKAFFSILNKRTSALFPATIKHPVLRPAGWAFVTNRYLLKLISGKRNTDMARNMLQRRANRQEFSDKWHLYEKSDHE